MIKVNVILNNIAWKKYLKNPKNFINKQINILNKKENKYKKKVLIFNLLLSNSTEVKKLNKKFRKKNKTTDILSFPFYNKKLLNKKINTTREVYLGDVIINLSKVKYKNNIKKFHEEFNKLWIHGIVHLFGYKHQRNKDFFKMNKIEKKYFSYLI